VTRPERPGSLEGASTGGQEVDAPSRAERHQKVFGEVVGAAGVAGLATAGVFAGLAAIAKGAYAPHCGAQIGAPPSHCDPEGIADHSDAVFKANVATGALVAGAVALTAGVTLFVTARHARRAAAVTLAPAEIRLSGEF
jgi:hypothetical protein